MSSGVGVSEESLTVYQDLKLKKIYKFITFTLNDKLTEIVVKDKSDNADWESFVSVLPENECRWAVYDLEFQKEGGKRNKLVFVSWVPDNAKVKQKMLFASSRDALRRSLVGIAAEVQATDFSEIALEEVHEKIKRFT